MSTEDPYMFVEIPESLLRDRRLSGTELRVYCLLSNTALVSSNCFDDTVVNEMIGRLKEPQHKIWRAIQNLCRYGYLEQATAYNNYRLLAESDIDGQQHAQARKFDALEYPLPWPQLQEAWDRWINYYQGKFDRIDLMQAEALVNHVSTLLDQGTDINSAVNNSIAGGYRQIYHSGSRQHGQSHSGHFNRQNSRKETPFERQKRIIQEKRSKRKGTVD